MSKQSAGILVFRRQASGVEVLLVHPGGPFWAKKDSWSIPKGELEADEDHLSAAQREFAEELGMPAPTGELTDLGAVKQPGKVNFIWAVEGTIDLAKFKSNTFAMEWPPHSGQELQFPENDRAAWFDLITAKRKLFRAQAEFIDRLASALNIPLIDIAPPEQQSLL